MRKCRLRIKDKETGQVEIKVLLLTEEQIRGLRDAGAVVNFDIQEKN